MNYRHRANAVLSIVFILFLLITGAKHVWPENFLLRLCQFVLEASLVGGIADWFAVTALFRKPLGWPYHTALIPRNRTQMIAGIRDMVENELLSTTLLQQKIQDVQLTKKILAAIEKRGGADFIAARLADFLPGLQAKVDERSVAKKLSAFIRGKGQAGEGGRRILTAAQALLHRPEFEHGLDEGIERLLIYASGSRAAARIRLTLETVKEQQLAGGGFLQKTLYGMFQAADGVNLDEATDALQGHLILTLRRLQDPDNALRLRLKAQLEQGLEIRKNDGLTAGQIEEWLIKILDELPLETTLETAIAKILAIWRDGEFRPGESLVSALTPFVTRFWNAVQTDEALQETLDVFFRDTLIWIVQKEHGLLGEIVQETLEDLSDDELNRFIEDKTGNDLQWIRINGSIVGGILGLLLFLVLNFGYQPLLKTLP